MSHVWNGSLTRLLAVLAVSCLIEGTSAEDGVGAQPLHPAATGGGSGTERMRIPNKAAQTRAAETVTEVYGDAITKAKKPAEKAALAEQLLKTGRDTAGDPAARYALLVAARDHAVAGGNADLAIEAAEQLGNDFRVDRLGVKVQVIAKLGGGDDASLLRHAEALADEAIVADRFGLAKQAADAATASARRSGNRQAITRTANRVREIANIQQAFGAAKAAAETLKADPADPKANGVLGKYRCLVKGDWAAGLPLLAKGDDAALKAMAQADLDGPEDPAAQVAVADGWWDLSEKQSAAARDHMRRRAATWYASAAPGLTGLVKVKIEKRLAESQGVAKGEGAGEPPDGTPLAASDGNAEAAYRDLRSPRKKRGSAAGGQKPDRGSVVTAYVDDLRRRGWHAQAAAVAREEMTSARLSSEAKRDLQAAYSASAVAFADAWLAFGNVRMAKRAVDAVAKAGKSVDAGEVKRLKSDLEAMGKDVKPSVLSATQPVSGVVVWPAAPGGYALNGAVQVGHNKGNHGGEKDAVGNVTAEAGFFLDGGTLSVSNGSIQFKGTAEKPVVLKRVQIWCELTGVVRAEHTIFEDCTFHKTGAFFWGEYSSKWEFQDCLLRNSTFASLARLDYGVKAARCTFVQCKLPPRTGVPGKEESIDNDAAALIRHEWSGINDCDFYYCELPTSVVWMTQGSNFFFCNVSEASDFASKTDLEVTLGLPAGADELMEQLAASTNAPGKGKATYTRAAEVFPREQPTTLWRWLDGAGAGKAASK